LPERAERHPQILRYRNEPKRFKIVHAGRRSFKTEIAKRTLVAEAMSRPGVSLFFGAPTRDQGKRIAWEDIKALTPSWVVKRISETDMRLQYGNGSEIWVLGFDRPERFDGKSQWHGGILDEYADMDEAVWGEHVEPAIRDTRGWVWFVGVPEGKNHYFELLDRYRDNPQWGEYSWKSADVMGAEEIAEARAHCDERTFRQEYEGSFETYDGLAYPYHDRDTHCYRADYDPRVPVILCCDFNIDPCLWLFGQDSPERTYISGEIRQQRTDIWKMCNEAKSRLDEYTGGNARSVRLRIYGDYQHGTARGLSATAGSWEIIESEFAGWNVDIRKRPNPRILDRVNSTNSRMRTASGSVRFGYSPDCVELRKDYEMVSMGDFTKADQGQRTHACSAVDYMINYEYPVAGRATWRAV